MAKKALPSRSSARILFLDIETLPNIGYTWGLYDQNVIRFTQQSCIATYAAKWLGKKKVFAKALPDYKGYKSGSYDDRALVGDLWKLFDEADVVVAHNGKSFDTKVCQSRFVLYDLKPPSPFKQVDTKLAVKRVARFNSAKLDDLGSLLGFGKKIKTDFGLWEGCINGDLKSWRKMVAYNKKDVRLLEKLYLRILPWIGNHPNLAMYDKRPECPKCGSTEVSYRGTAITTTRSYQRFQCKKCGGWGRSVKSEGSVKVTNVANE